METKGGPDPVAHQRKLVIQEWPGGEVWQTSPLGFVVLIWTTVTDGCREEKKVTKDLTYPETH